jgi:GTP cyclohydrolase II
MTIKTKIKKIDFKKGNGLVPAIIQDKKTGGVLMLGYMNEEALRLTLETKLVHFWSRSRNKIWLKGEESGNKLKLIGITTDCDYDTLLVFAELIGKNICHTGKKSCFFNILI